MTKIHRLGLVILILISCAGCDQAAKSIARETLSSSPPLLLLNGAIRVEYTENPGAILSLGANWPAEARFIFFVVLVGLILAATLTFALKARGLSLVQLAALSFIAAGGIGNFLDRLFNDGQVIDYVSVGVGPLRTGVFNVADVAIMGGVLAFLLFSAKERAH